jgi:hypothetical protein
MPLTNPFIEGSHERTCRRTAGMDVYASGPTRSPVEAEIGDRRLAEPSFPGVRIPAVRCAYWTSGGRRPIHAERDLLWRWSLRRPKLAGFGARSSPLLDISFATSAGDSSLRSMRADLAAALAEAEWLATAACRHPTGAVDGGTCRAWGTEVGSRTLHMQGHPARRIAPPGQRLPAAGLPLAQFVSA